MFFILIKLQEKGCTGLHFSYFNCRLILNKFLLKKLRLQLALKGFKIFYDSKHIQIMYVVKMMEKTLLTRAAVHWILSVSLFYFFPQCRHLEQ